MTLQQEKIELDAELKVCANFLRERSITLPKNLKETDLQVLSVRERVKLMNERLEEIANIEEKQRVAEAKKIKESVAKVIKLKDKLYRVNEEIQAEVGTLHGSHKGFPFEVSRAIAQLIKQHKPEPKKTRKKAS